MATSVARKDAPVQFLFTVSHDAPLISGFKINSDGSLEPVPGSPFVTSMPMRSVVALHNTLIVATEDSMATFIVNKNTGAIQQSDVVKTGAISQLVPGRSEDVAIATMRSGVTAFSVFNGKIKALPDSMTANEMVSAKSQPAAVLDATGRFIYVADAAKAELSAFQIENGRTIPLPTPAYPVPHGTAAMAVVKPNQ